MKYRTFKNEVSNLKDYKEQYKRLQDKIEDIIYLYAGVKGVRYDGVSISYNQADSDEKLLILSEKIKPYQERLNRVYATITQIESNISKLPKDTQEMVKKLFIENFTFKQVGEMFGYSDNALHHKVKREVEKYI